MKTQQRHLILLICLFLTLLGWNGKAWAAYPNAPTISTSGSADYSSIATAINSWKNAWSPDRGAYNNRSTIIDNVEATLKAAGKASITDSEYDALADALYWWLHQVVVEGSAAGDNRGGWYISGIGIPETFFSNGNPYNCVWELNQATVHIAKGSIATNGYGPMLGDNVRMVLVTNLAQSTIVRNSDLCNVMFSTNGVNSKLLVMGRKNHKIAFKGDVNWSDPSSYTEVLNRSVTSGQRGQLVTVNSGSLMTAYTTFHSNVTLSTKCSYKYYYNYTSVPPAAAPDGITVSNSNGGAIGVYGKMNCCSFYYTDIKNNATSEGSRFGGGIGFTNIAAKTPGTDGNVYFNHCTIKGNRNASHGGGVALYINDDADGRNVYFKDTELSYNCQASVVEAHGGGLWVVNKYNSDLSKQRKVYFDGCTFTGNYACGKTAAGGGISNEGTIILENCAFNSNVAANSFGGAIYNRPQMAEGNEKGVDLTLKGCSFTGNQCTWTGDLDIDTNDPISNPTRGSGGAIMIDIYRKNDYAVSENYVVKLDIESNCTFTNNHADRNGGAIAVAACRDMESWMDNPPAGHGTLTSNMEIKSATMSGNTAGKNVTWPTGRGNYGGAVYLSYTNLNVTGGNSDIQIKNNGNVNGFTNTQYGGAVAIYKGNLTLSGGTFGTSGNGNKATYGGAFYINQGTVNFNGGIIASNTASQSGGGVYVENGNFNMKGGTIGGSATADGNSATAGHGGGVYVATGGICTINGGTIGYNKATNGNGGGFYVDPGTSGTTTINSDNANTSISNNSAKNGGGAYINTGTLNVAATSSRTTQVLSNTATINGGGMYANGKVSLTGVNLNGNTAQGSGDTNGGGGIFVTGNNNNIISGGTVNGNHATNGNGGGVFVTSGTNNTLSISGTTQINSNDAKKGGGVYVAQGMLSVTGTNASNKAHIESNEADIDGGGVYVAAGSVTASNASIDSNVSTGGNGGGIYAVGAVTLTGGSVSSNTASSGNGGGIYAKAGSNTITVQTSAQVNGNEAQNGGGIFAESGMVQITSSQVSSNTADTNGGGIYAQAGSVSANSSTINDNTAEGGNGGGIYALSQVTVTGGTVNSNFATSGNGGGIYAKAGSYTITVQTNAAVNGNEAQKGGGIYAESGSVQVTSSTLSGNIADVDGGGVYAEGGAVTMTSATLSSNQADSGDGGGIYGGGGNITVNGGSITTNQADSGNGGGVYAISGTITFNSSSKAIPTFTGNTAKNGGVLFMEGGTCNINAGTLGGSHANRNKAAENGGAIYADNGTVNFATGEISYNTAGLAGGGLYVATGGTLNMTGNVSLDYNHVPSGKHGGGVYLAGVIQIGASTASTVEAQYNFASGTVDTDPSSVTINSSNRNNVYLPNPTVNTSHKDVITVVKNGLTTSTRVGFSVPANFVPVIYCNESADYPYLRSFLAGGTMAATVFDDSEKYSTVHYANNSFYNPQHIYLSGGTWVDHVNSLGSVPEGFSVSGNNVTISSSDGLAWLIKYINGLPPVTTTPQPDVDVTLTADLDMGDYAWVPMGYTENSTVFTGTFDGQGHTISNLICEYLGTQTGSNLGLFGTMGSNATVKNVQLKDAKVNTSNMDSGTAWLGAIAGLTTGGVIESCVVDAEMETLNASAVIGGVVGSNGATLRSCFATADMKGYQMGGLVGANSGDLYNSYAYTKFDYNGSSKYFGGLVGVNTGRVENCYSRVQGTAPNSTYFGWLAGDNTSASGKGLYFCYSPNATYVATASGTTSGNQTGLSTFGTTAANAYDYRVRDNQVATTNDYAPTYDAHHLADYQLKKYLNNWVEQDDTHKATYAGWTRPTTQTINDDYPLLKLQDHNAVAATSGEVSLEYGDINTLLTSHSTAANSILFYGSKEGMDSNSGSAATLYIDENAVLTPSTAKEDGDIVAHVGITLDNSACHAGANPSFGDPDNIDWHFFSSSIANATIGLEYTNATTQYTYSQNPPDPQFTASSQYFPINLNSYYEDWDLYSYCEPHYHWINLKRNSLSHWHEDNVSQNITYTNETEYNAGQGFMVATKEDCYLQAYGTLNSNTSSAQLQVPVTYTTDILWTTRDGQNLLGNPYQSYLDFDAFANDANNKALWSSSVRPFYIIMDEDQADYVTYTKGQTANEARACRYLHPHQGFMIKISNSGTANFDNTMRKVTMDEGWSSTFRDNEYHNYALVNLFSKDTYGNRDMVTVELGRPEAGGLKKSLVPSTSTGRIYCHYEDEDYDLAFTLPGITEASIRFKTEEDTEYTMSWSTQHGDFSYLHLIDNMTGTDIDCLATDEYKFRSRTSDYESRFRLVFGYTGIEEPEGDNPSTGSETCNFAFMMGDHLVVNGEGMLQMFDVTGRLVNSARVHGEQNTISLPTLPAGVYMLRLEGSNRTQTQKIVIR